MVGWIKLHRDITRNWLWEHPLYLRGWVWLLCEANYDDRKWLVDGTIKLIRRGDIVTSLGKMADGTGMSVREVRTFLDLLIADDKVIKNSDKRMTHLTVCNYERYQDVRQANDTPATSERQASDNNIRSEEVNNILTDKAKPKNFESVLSYFVELGHQDKAESYWDFWESVGWKRKSGQMKDWRASARTWIRNSPLYDTATNTTRGRKQTAAEAIKAFGRDIRE